MELQARVRVWGRPRGRSGTRVPRASSTHCVREDARVGAGSDGGEESDLGATNGEDIYDGVTFERRRVEAMKTARRWRAYWEDEAIPARMGDVRNMILDAPGLGIGEVVTFTVDQLNEQSGHVSITQENIIASATNGAVAKFSAWYNSALVQRTGEGVLPRIAFRIRASAIGRAVASRLLHYSDVLEFRVLYGDHSEEIAADQVDYRIHSPWGVKSGTTASINGENGWIHEFNLPPGGISLVVGDLYLMGSET